MRQLRERADIKGGADVVTAAASRDPFQEERVAVACARDACFAPLPTSRAFC
jgi:hypothetical protein